MRQLDPCLRRFSCIPPIMKSNSVVYCKCPRSYICCRAVCGGFIMDTHSTKVISEAWFEIIAHRWVKGLPLCMQEIVGYRGHTGLFCNVKRTSGVGQLVFLAYLHG